MSGTAGKGPDDRPEGAPDPLEDAEMKAALEAAKQRRAPGEDPLFYSVEEDARRGAEGQQGEQVYVGPKTVPPAPVGRATASRVKVSAAVEAADPRRAVTVVGGATGGGRWGGCEWGCGERGCCEREERGAFESAAAAEHEQHAARGGGGGGAARSVGDRGGDRRGRGGGGGGGGIPERGAFRIGGGLERRDLGDRGAAGRERLGDEQRGRGGGAERAAAGQR